MGAKSDAGDRAPGCCLCYSPGSCGGNARLPEGRRWLAAGAAASAAQGDRKTEAALYNQLGLLERYLGNDRAALSFYLRSLAIKEQLDETAMFAPRPDLVREVENALTATYGKPIMALYGPRRRGKTTFLLHLPRLLPDEVVPVFVDLQEAVQVSGLGGLYYNWAVAACDAARERWRLTLPRPALADFSPEPAIAWREWLDDAERALGEQALSHL